MVKFSIDFENQIEENNIFMIEVNLYSIPMQPKTKKAPYYKERFYFGRSFPLVYNEEFLLFFTIISSITQTSGI